MIDTNNQLDCHDQQNRVQNRGRFTISMKWLKISPWMTDRITSPNEVVVMELMERESVKWIWFVAHTHEFNCIYYSLKILASIWMIAPFLTDAKSFPKLVTRSSREDKDTEWDPRHAMTWRQGFHHASRRVFWCRNVIFSYASRGLFFLSFLSVNQGQHNSSPLFTFIAIILMIIRLSFDSGSKWLISLSGDESDSLKNERTTRGEKFSLMIQSDFNSFSLANYDG